MATLAEIRQKRNWAATVGLGDAIQDNSGILARMTKKEANKVLRYSMRVAAQRFKEGALPRRFTSAVNLSPWNYPIGGNKPLQASGRAKRQILRRRSVKATATGANKVRVQIPLSIPPYMNFKPYGRNIHTGQREKLKKPMHHYITMVSSREAAILAQDFGRILTGVLNNETVTETRTIQRGVNAGQTRSKTRLSGSARQRLSRS